MSDFYCEEVFSGKTKVKIVKETENTLAFYHTKPSWTTHIVIVPKLHVENLLAAKPDLIIEIVNIAQNIIKELKLNESNYKLITNGGSFQDGNHLHFHLVSGKRVEDIGE